MNSARQFLSSYGRRKSRVLSQHQKYLLEKVLPKYLYSPDTYHSSPIINLEIGFGNGEHLLHRAMENPEQIFIGCEVYLNGIISLLQKIEKHNIKNIRFFQEDVRLLLEKLPKNSLTNTYILFPDPWPKKRHHKRRLINQETLTMLERVIAPGGRLIIATDWENYLEWILVNISAHGGFTFNANSADDWLNTPPNHIATKYEQKAVAEGRAPVFMEFRTS